MKINPNHAGWLLHTTIVNTDGSLISQTCYQHTCNISMLELLKEQKAWAKKDCQFPMHFHLMGIHTYAPSSGWMAMTHTTEEELEFYAKHDQDLIDAKKSSLV